MPERLPCDDTSCPSRSHPPDHSHVQLDEHEQFTKALEDPAPYDVLRKKAQNLAAKVGRNQVVDLLESLRLRLENDGNSRDESVVINVLDSFSEWCPADQRIHEVDGVPVFLCPAQEIEGLPGVFVLPPEPIALEEGEIDLGMEFTTELFTVVDTNPTSPPAAEQPAAEQPIVYARCAHDPCQKRHPKGIEHVGPTKLATTHEGVLVRVCQVLYFCSEECRAAWLADPHVEPREPDPEIDPVVLAFKKVYYDEARRSRTWVDTKWMGIHVLKTPTDLWAYQEIIFETKPDIIIETGTFNGGSALYMAHVLDVVGGYGKVVTVDVEAVPDRPRHERIVYLDGSSTSKDVLQKVCERIESARTFTKEYYAREPRVMVVLDSDHSRGHVLAELRAYAPLVSRGCYLIVEDTNVAGEVAVGMDTLDGGPSAAVREFLEGVDGEGKSFAVDGAREKFLLSFNPGGFLCRVR